MTKARMTILETAALFAAVFVVVLFLRHTEAPPHTTHVTIGDVDVIAEVAATPLEREQGLSGRQQLQQNTGMLFVFNKPSVPSFWMKDMRFSIDIIWIDGDMRVVGTERNVSPDTYPQTFSPIEPVRYVLEVNAGWVDKHTIEPGDVVIVEE